MTLNIEHHVDKGLFFTILESHRAYIHYELKDDTMYITHTNVPVTLGGRGIAGELTEFALNTARQEGWKVVPQCSYTQAYLKRHPEFDDLRA